MRDAEAWAPSKFVRNGRGWEANRETVPLASWIAADAMAGAYAGMIERHACGRLVDLGCGAAPLYGMYGGRATEVVCIDWRDGRHEQRHVDLFHDLNEPLELEPEGFDTVVASDVVEHLHTPQALFDSAARLLRPGGALILGTPFFYWLHEEPHDYHRYNPPRAGAHGAARRAATGGARDLRRRAGDPVRRTDQERHELAAPVGRDLHTRPPGAADRARAALQRRERAGLPPRLRHDGAQVPGGLSAPRHGGVGDARSFR